MAEEDPNAGMVALLEALAEAKALIEELTRLGEELRARQNQLGELLAPSEAALQARTAYLDQVMREQLGRAEERLNRVTNEVQATSRNLSDRVAQMPALMVEVDRQRAAATAWREWWRIGLSLLAMLIGGFLAGQVTTCRRAETIPRAPAAPSIAPTKNPPSPRVNRPGTNPPPAH